MEKSFPSFSLSLSLSLSPVFLILLQSAWREKRKITHEFLDALTLEEAWLLLEELVRVEDQLYSFMVSLVFFSLFFFISS